MIGENFILPKHYEIEEELREQLGCRAGRQRCVVGEQELLLILHDVPDVGVPERKAIFFWRRYDGQWLQSKGEGLRELEELFRKYSRVIDAHEKMLNQTESTKTIFMISRHASPLMRSLRHTVQALSQAFAQEPDDRAIRNALDQAHELERAAELLQSDARETIAFSQAEASEEHLRSSEKLGKALFKLNLVTGFFLPLVALGSLFGMNVKLPGFIDHLFWVIFIIALGFGGILLWYVWQKDDSKSKGE